MKILIGAAIGKGTFAIVNQNTDQIVTVFT